MLTMNAKALLYTIVTSTLFLTVFSVYLNR
jgi:hypothetical protein